jgi:hypothetical protein
MPVHDMTDLSAIDRRPLVDDGLIRAARDIALIGSGLMQCQGAVLLTLALPNRAEHDALVLTLWDESLRPCRDPRCARPDHLLGPALATLDRASSVMFDRLATARLLRNAAAFSCIVTDGTGVILTAGRPPRDAHALIAAAGRRGNAVTILPTAPDSVWTLMAADRSYAPLN